MIFGPKFPTLQPSDSNLSAQIGDIKMRLTLLVYPMPKPFIVIFVVGF
jgi:hypothetical protein